MVEGEERRLKKRRKKFEQKNDEKRKMINDGYARLGPKRRVVFTPFSTVHTSFLLIFLTRKKKSFIQSKYIFFKNILKSFKIPIGW